MAEAFGAVGRGLSGAAFRLSSASVRRRKVGHKARAVAGSAGVVRSRVGGSARMGLIPPGLVPGHPAPGLKADATLACRVPQA